MPFLSIIVPVYRAEAHISQCVGSILDQVFTDLELILIDDGSPDNSGAICDAYAAKDPRVRVVHKQNEGLVRARKSGLQLATGEYIGFVDADDWIEPEMFERLCGAAISTQAEVVGCGFFIDGPDGRRVGRGAVPPGLYDKEGLRSSVYPIMLTTKKFGEYGITPNVWCKIFERSLLASNIIPVPDQLRNGEDGAITYACLMDARSFCLLGDSLYHYRQHPDQMTRDWGSSHLNSLLLWVGHLRRKADCTSVAMGDQIDYYIQYKVSMMLASSLDEGVAQRDLQLVRAVSSEAMLRQSLARRGLGEVSWEARAAFLLLKNGHWRTASISYRSTRVLKRVLRFLRRLR